MPSKWMKDFLDKKHEEHRKRVKQARSTLDKSKPPSMPMSMRREMERRRIQSSIEQDNRLLMDRIGEAMSHKNIDNELKAKPFVSYIELQRKKDMVRITGENKRLLSRIQKTSPSYNHLQWEQEAEKRMDYLRTMTQFPDLFNPPGLKHCRSMTAGKKTSPRREDDLSEAQAGGVHLLGLEQQEEEEENGEDPHGSTRPFLPRIS
eukprot:gene8227-9074_t